MTTLSLSGKAARRRSLTRQPFGSSVAEFLAGARDGLEIQARYDALARKSDKELAALGLTRDQIGRAAVTGKLP